VNVGEKELYCMIPWLGVRWIVHETYLKTFVVFYVKCWWIKAH
jgi:hypothetical protein